MQEHKINRISSFDLMERIKNSDQLALRILYGRLWERMYVLAFSMLHDEAVSKDIVQEIWIDLWERRNKNFAIASLSELRLSDGGFIFKCGEYIPMWGCMLCHFVKIFV